MSGWEVRALVGVRVHCPNTLRVPLHLGDARWSRWKLRSNLLRLQEATSPVRAGWPTSGHCVRGQREEGAGDRSYSL
jgi:hypothetical protein